MATRVVSPHLPVSAQPPLLNPLTGLAAAKYPHSHTTTSLIRTGMPLLRGHVNESAANAAQTKTFMQKWFPTETYPIFG
jgi:hypothetical protein